MITSEQSRLIEDNYKLVFFFIKEKGLELNEWHGIISEALIKAVKNYDKNKGSFSNFFHCVAYGAMKNEYRRRGREVQTCLGILESIEDTVDEDGLEVHREDCDFEEIFGGRLGTVAKMLSEGHNQASISRELNLSHTTISRDVEKIKEMILEGDIWKY